MRSSPSRDLPGETLARALRAVDRGRRAYKHYLAVIKAQRAAVSRGRWAELAALQARMGEISVALGDMQRVLRPIRARIASGGLTGANVTKLDQAMAAAAREAALVSYHLNLLTTATAEVRDRAGAALGRTLGRSGAGGSHDASTAPGGPPAKARASYGPLPDRNRVLDRAG